MLCMATIRVILLWYIVPSLASLLTQRRQGFQINPKPCWVDGQEGTCMFVYECIKSEGYHIGMCVDTFMFGSCCAHNLRGDTMSQATQPKPQVLYSVPTYNANKSVILSSKIVICNGLPSTSKFTSQRCSNAKNVTVSHWTTVKPPLLANSASSGQHSLSNHPTHSSRISFKPFSTDAQSENNSIPLGSYNKDSSFSPTEPNFISSVVEKVSVHIANKKGSNWTNKQDINTKVKKPTAFKKKTKKPTKKSKPSKSTTKNLVKPHKITTSITRLTKYTKPFIVSSIDNHLNDGISNNSMRDIFLESQRLNKEGCGSPRQSLFTKSRIVGGKATSFGKWPWQASVRRTSFFGFSSTHRCGGAIINKNWVATAGHCVDDLLISQIRVRVGDYDFLNAQEELPHAERGILRKVVHPNYNFFTYEYDLALVLVDKELEFALNIWPICLPPSDALLIGENATVTGWGRLNEGGTLPSILQEVQVPVVSNNRCKEMFLEAGRYEHIPDIFICAGHDKGGMDSCQGDSGGPLQIKGNDGRYFLAGIISWGIGCAEANLPGVCTRVSKFVPWILKNISNSPKNETI